MYQFCLEFIKKKSVLSLQNWGGGIISSLCRLYSPLRKGALNEKLTILYCLGKYVLGYKQTLKTLRSGKSKLVIIASNTPPLRQVKNVYIVREAAKKVLLLIAGPLRPYHTPLTPGLNGRRIFFRYKKAGNGLWHFILLSPIFGLL